MPTVYPRGHIIERFPIWPHGEGRGQAWSGQLIQGGDRPTQRIIKVFAEDGTKLWEGGGYDQANAVNAFETWLKTQMPAAPAPVCDICHKPIVDGQTTADTHACRDCMRRTIAAVEGTAHEQFVNAAEADLPDPTHEYGEPVG